MRSYIICRSGLDPESDKAPCRPGLRAGTQEQKIQALDPGYCSLRLQFRDDN